MLTKTILGQPYTFDPTKDDILQHGMIVRYYHSESPEDKVVLKEFIYWSARYQTEIIIPRWFVCDQASVPTAFRSVISKAGPMEYASLPHDFGYTLPAYHQGSIKLDRGDWDKVLKDFLDQQGMSKTKRWLSYMAVKLGGNVAYDNSDKMFFCPDWNKQHYIDHYYYLDIPFENGEYKVI